MRPAGPAVGLGLVGLLALGASAEASTLVVEQRGTSAHATGRLVLVRPGVSPQPLTEGFHDAAEPDVSFDGTTVVFAARRTATDPWCIWEVPLAGGDPRRISCGRGGARQPAYLPTMHTLTTTATEPWEQIVFVGRLPGEVPDGGSGVHTALFACRRDGSRLRRLTFNLSNDRDPTVLPDGRILYAADRARSVPTAALYAINTDGTDLMIFAGDEGRPVKRAPVWVGGPGRRVVFVESHHDRGWGGLASVSLARNLHSHQALTAPGEAWYRSPSRGPDGILVSRRLASGHGTWGIHSFDPETGRTTPVFDDAEWDEVEAQPLLPRPVPDGRSSSVRGDEAVGWLYGLDVGISDLEAPDWTRGVPQTLRVLEGVAESPDGASGRAPRRLLGEVDLAADGSFHVQVPADTPLELQLLDDEGVALRSCRWIWTRRREARGCIGCHEDPERTPPNRLAEAVQSPAARFDRPIPDRPFVSYRRDVQPIVERRCLGCHGPEGESLRLDGEPKAAHEELLKGSVHPGQARTSPLARHLVGHPTARPWDGPKASPDAAPSRVTPELTADERRTLLRWIDLGALFDHPSAAGATAVAGGQ